MDDDEDMHWLALGGSMAFGAIVWALALYGVWKLFAGCP